MGKEKTESADGSMLHRGLGKREARSGGLHLGARSTCFLPRELEGILNRGLKGSEVEQSHEKTLDMIDTGLYLISATYSLSG